MAKKTASTPATEKPVKTPKSAAAPKKEKAPKAAAAAPVENTVVPETPVVEDGAAPAADVCTTAAKLSDFGSKLSQLSSLISALKAEHKLLEKTVMRDFKAAQKGSFRRKRNSGNRQPSGFVKPTRISDELAVFLGKEKGAEMARTSVSKEINQYIKSHNLQDKANGRTIIPDASLKKLLGVKADETLTYFNLQRYLKHHFVKAETA